MTELAAIYVYSLAVLAYLAYVSPKGYQDETGFHYGSEDSECS